MAAGCPVVSTPYFYAEDLLASGAGVLVPFEDPDAMSTAVLDLLDDPARLASARIESRRIGSGLAWSQVAIDTLEVLREAMEVHERREQDPNRKRCSIRSWPDPKLDHLLTLVDDVGILEHACGTVPLLGGGYCVDDVARLAVVSSGLLRASDDAHSDHQGGGCSPGRSPSWCTPTTRPSGALHNILGYDRRWADEPHDGDHLGRTVWALGAVLADEPRPELTGATTRLLTALAPALAASTSPRSVAYGLDRARPARARGAARRSRRSARAAGQPAGRLGTSRPAGPGWPWFEPYLTYDNARLPQALLLAGRRTGSERCTRIGLETLDWYAAQCHLDGGFVRLVGNRWRFPPAATTRPSDLADGRATSSRWTRPR